jgi:hypothetical protein
MHGRQMRIQLRQIANARTVASAVAKDSCQDRADAGGRPNLIQRKEGAPAAGNSKGPLPNRAAASNQTHRWEELMSAAQQALLMTGELFALSFAAIFAVWFADRLRRGITGRP